MAHLAVKRESRARVVLLLLVAALVMLAVAAAPAAAAPAPTTLTVNAQSASVNWNATAILNGILQATGNPPQLVDGQDVLVESAPTSLGPWTFVATVTNSAAPYSSGEYTYSWKASANAYWRMRFAGTAEWASATSTFKYIQVKPVLGKPARPASVKAGHKFTVSGLLKPKYPSGSKNVTVRAQRYSHGKWRSYKTYTATTRNSGAYSKYSVRLSISKKGKYRFYATTANTTTLAAGRSAYSRSMQVK